MQLICLIVFICFTTSIAKGSVTLSSLIVKAKMTLKLFTLLSLLLLFVQAHNQNFDLKSVHVVFRHGARTPTHTYINDIHANETFEPFGWGQLTNVSKL